MPSLRNDGRCTLWLSVAHLAVPSLRAKSILDFLIVQVARQNPGLGRFAFVITLSTTFVQRVMRNSLSKIDSRSSKKAGPDRHSERVLGHFLLIASETFGATGFS